MSGERKPRTDAELWAKLTDDAELDAVLEMPSADVDAELRVAGGDPDAIGSRGAALAARLLADHDVDWRERAAKRRDDMKARAGDWPDFTKMPRPELVRRLAVARADSRFGASVVTAFRKRKEEEASDDELREILEDIEVTARLADAAKPNKNDKNGGGSESA